MKAFKGKVAVITGAASGIGLGIAKYCVKEGIKTVLSDVEENLLNKVTEELKSKGGDVLAVKCDVSKFEDVQNLANLTIKTYKKVNLLFNNAGVIPRTNILKNTLKDYQWVIGVNLWGVIYCVLTFLPIMLEQNEECHIVNTSSGSSFNPGNGAYDVAKFGVNALTESTRIELNKIKTKVNVSLLVPGIVDTGIVDSNRNRPKELKNPSKANRNWDEINKKLEVIRNKYRGSMSPNLVADMTFNAIRNNKFYIFCEMGMQRGIEERHKSILDGFETLKEYLSGNKIN